MKKRIVSLCMALLMVVSLLPSTVFAADAVTITVGDASAEAGGTVTVDLNITGASSAAFMAVYLDFDFDAALTLTDVALSSAATSAGFTMGTNNLPQGIVQIEGNTTTGSSIEDGVLATLTFSVDGTANGEYSISVGYLENDEDNVYDIDFNNVACNFTAGSVTVGTSAPTAGYTATMTTSAANNEVVSGSNINVNVAVSHSSDTVFNAGEIKLTYDSSKLTPNTTSLESMVTNGTLSGYKVINNELVIEDFGGDKSMPYTYSIPFTAAEVSNETTGTVTLTRAAFIHKDNASSSDLIEATKSPESLTVTIKVAMVNVTLTNNADSSSTTTTTQKGVAYTFAPTDTANYTYSNVTANVGGSDVTVTDNGDGTFTITADDVTGDIALSYTKTAKSYTVTYEGEGADDITGKPITATYGQDLTVTLPVDKAPGTEPGYTYGISAKIGETSVGTYDESTRTLTIKGTDITGDITVTVTKQEVSATNVTITVAGDSGLSIEGVTGNTTTVPIGTSVTLVLNEEAGYIYKVVDSENNEVTFTDGKYTFTALVTETYTVTKTLNVETVQVTEYVKVDSYIIYLVTYDGTLAESKVPTYDNNVMFWSDKYDAYCWLVIDSTLTAETAMTKIGAQSGTAAEVDYDMDINGTGTTDAADAQLVWNMYNAMYDNFGTVTMAQFLAADQNATSAENWGLNVQDAQVIINAILSGNATT